MRLLLFNLATDTNDPILGFTTRWLCALAKRVEFIHVITMRAGRVEVPENVRVHSVGKEKGFTESKRLVEFYKCLRRVLSGDRIDVCFSHMIPIFTILSAPVLKLKGIPIVTWYCHPSLTSVLKLAHYCSGFMVSSLQESYPYKHDKLIVIGHGIDTALFRPDDLTLAESPPMILCAGRLSPVKDHPTLLKATSILRRMSSKPFRIVIIGGPATTRDKLYERSLKRQVKELGLEETICFQPPVAVAELPVWYRRSAVHVNLAATGGGDKVAWEAMACGIPSLVANLGFTETLGKYAERLLFKFGDAEQLAEKLHGMLSLSGSERKEVGTYLRQQVVSMHGLDRLAENLVRVFELLAASKRQRGAGRV